MPETNPTPRRYLGVMVSSTFTDLKRHRHALIAAIRSQQLKEVAMENDTAKADVDVIDSSLQMVQDASAYIGVISRKYGQTPACPKRNPKNLSITELEFNEAMRLGRPILLFIMSEKHLVPEADVELNSAKRKKLNAFRERAKQMKPDSLVHRVYATFDDLTGFNTNAIHAVAGLRRFLDEQDACSSKQQPQSAVARSLRTIRIFLASSAELREDRDAFDLYFRQQNDSLRKNGIYLEIVRWEYFLDAMSETRLQDEYNKAIRKCDVFVSLFFTKTGKFTGEEFEVAHRQFKATRKPLIYTYFKNSDIKTGSIQEADLLSLLAFKKKLNDLGHFHTNYDNIEHLKRQFRDQLDELLDQSQF